MSPANPPPPSISLFPAHTWETSYRNEDGNLVDLFYVPALSCAVQYDRMTGYFSADALKLAARGIERLIANDGRMRLIVGCTLDVDEIEAVERGYDLRDLVDRKLTAIDLSPPDPRDRHGLEALAWMIGTGHLDIKIAIPTDARGQLITTRGIYHEKVGIMTDREGNRLSFSGSNNETAGGWLRNRESFHVYLSWEGGRDARHVQDEADAFEKLWDARARSVRVLDFPEAARQQLLEFMPRDDRFLTVVKPPPPPLPPAPPPELSQRLFPEEVRRVVWTFIREAARMPNGGRVGEVTSTVQPWPHQVRAYQRLLDAWPCQMLIADEVGLGKTITAGLFLRQAWLSGRAGRILLLVPRSLLTQWQSELHEKFNLDVPIYDGQKLVWKRTHARPQGAEERVGRDAWHRQPFVLTSSHLMRRRDRAAELLQASDWDLIVLDEAHHARRKSPGTPQEGGPNGLLRLLQGLRPKCRSLVLLTATPMQVHPVELWDLLQLLGLPDRWGMGRDLFLRYFAEASGNPSHETMEFLAAMFRECEGEFGEVTEDDVARLVPGLDRLACRKVLRGLHDRSGIPLKRLEGPQRRAALEVLRRFTPIRHRMSRHTRNLLREYHRQGLIDSPIATRDVHDVPFDMTASERALYDALGSYIDQTYNNATPEKRSAIGFVLTVYQRRLASSFFALKRTLEKRLERMGGITDEDLAEDDDDRDDQLEPEEADSLALEALANEERATIVELLGSIAKIGVNTKARTLRDQLDRGQGEGYGTAIIFTQYSDTMDYLKEFLGEEYPGEVVATYSGSGGFVRDRSGFWGVCSKEQIKQRLKAGSIRFLVCTDAAAEGLNFQFCGLLINYDLPWNPMKVEQRIGRIDRIGQKFLTIRVVNLAYNGTIEADVYFALRERIKLFEGLVGRLQPILSRLPRQFEQVALERRENQQAARERVLADLDQVAQNADHTDLDIDEVAADILASPAPSSPSLDLETLDAALNTPGVLPGEVQWRRLDAGTYALQLPGMLQPIRVTTSGDVFDYQFESHEFLSPGGSLFERVLHGAQSGDLGEDAATPARFWLVRSADSSRCRILASDAGSIRELADLRELLDVLEHEEMGRVVEGVGGGERAWTIV